MNPHNLIPYTRHDITQSDIDAVNEVLRSDFLTQGPKVAEFENLLAKTHHVSYCTVLSSATAALHTTYVALGLGPGDILVTTPITFSATANTALYCGASVVFSDIDPTTWNLSPEALEKTFISLKKNGKNVKMVSTVHFAGLLCEQEKIAEITHHYFPNAVIIEDAAHACGVTGICHPKSRAAILSFHPAKHIACGEGGAILTQDPDLHRTCQILRSHGIIKDLSESRTTTLSNSNAFGPWSYEIQILGWNYRLNDIACALGISQLNKLQTSLSQRKKNAQYYQNKLTQLSWIKLQAVSLVGNNNIHGYHLFPVCIDFETLGYSRTEVMAKLKQLGIGTQVHYIPIYKFSYYKNNLKIPQDCCPNAEAYYQKALSLPMYATLKISDLDRVIDAIKN